MRANIVYESSTITFQTNKKFHIPFTAGMRLRQEDQGNERLRTSSPVCFQGLKLPQSCLLYPDPVPSVSYSHLLAPSQKLPVISGQPCDNLQNINPVSNTYFLPTYIKPY